MNKQLYGERYRLGARKEMWRKLPRMSKKEQERVLMLHANFDRAAAGEEQMYYAEPKEQEGGERNYILPFGKSHAKWDPYDTFHHPFEQTWLAGMNGLICRRLDQARTRPTRIIFSYGQPLSPSDRVNMHFVARHDQTNALLGTYRVVGVIVYDPFGYVGLTVGDVPHTKLAMSTYK